MMFSKTLENKYDQNISRKSEFDKIDSAEDINSICDIWKDCTHKFIRKAEQKTPVYIQTYTQIHSEFLHCIDNIFGSCYLWQKQYFDKLGIPKSTINEYEKSCRFFLDEITSQMDSFAKISQLESNYLIDTMQSSNNYVRQGLDWYAKIMTNLLRWF